MRGKCGICWIAGQHGAEIDGTLLNEMTDLMRHRGPDERDAWISPASNIGLGARRFSLLGVRNGSQPILSENESCILVVNWRWPTPTSSRSILISPSARLLENHLQSKTEPTTIRAKSIFGSRYFWQTRWGGTL